MPSMVIHDSDRLGHVNENLLIANEIVCGREDVRRSSQESNNDVGDEHGEAPIIISRYRRFCESVSLV